MNYQLRIELISDMCVSDGGVYNSSLDTDVCHDEYGFPFIPARRIKGCLRECGLELNDWGEDIPLDKMFGDKGKNEKRAKARIGNAYLENYENLKLEVMQHVGNTVYHPQNILNHYSYVRTQTSIDYDKGAADPNSLRTTRVVNKGLTFIANIEMPKEFEPPMRDCCRAFTNIGMGRTRGLGEICCELKQGKADLSDNNEQSTLEFQEGATRLYYEIYLEEPMICKSTSGGETRSLDYIEGSKILGLIAGELKKKNKDFSEFMDRGELFCSNAYIMENGERYTEVPAYLYELKNDHENYVDKRFSLKENSVYLKKQQNMMKHCYISFNEKGELKRKEVALENRYHHRRPEDKSIGRAIQEPSGDSDFYQMSSIEAGQQFGGYITGTEEQIRQIYDLFSETSTIYMGYANSAEYGRAKLHIINMADDGAAEQNTEEIITDLTVKLESPALIYNDRAFYSTDVKDLDAEIRKVLGFDNQLKVDYIPFVNYTEIGGYNVTWNARKPVVQAFDKGTVLYYLFEQGVKLNVQKTGLIGERVSEGFGEISVKINDCCNAIGAYETLLKDKNHEEEYLVVQEDSLAQTLCNDLFEEYVSEKAAEDADTLEIWKYSNDVVRPTVSNMLLMCSEFSSLNEIEYAVHERFGDKEGQKENKKKVADEILDQVNSVCGSLKNNFCEKYKIKEEDNYEYVYLKSLLQQLKYRLRTNEGGNRNDE